MEKMNYDEDYPNPKHGKILVKVNLAGICGTDLEILDGYREYPEYRAKFVGTRKI